MGKTKYGITKAHLPPTRDLLRVPHKEGILTLAYSTFGPNTYRKNLETMSGNYSHPQTGKRISFREPTTSESISAAVYDFENLVKPKIFDSRWLQIGYIVITPEFVVANPPKNTQGNPISDEQTLKSYLNKSKKVNGIWLYNGENARDFGVAPYETFERGVQDGGKFAEGGLARILEHTREKVAKNLKVISSSKNYPKGVNVWGFDEVREPVSRVGVNVLRVAVLYSGRSFIGLAPYDGLSISGSWIDPNGFAFGMALAAKTPKSHKVRFLFK